MSRTVLVVGGVDIVSMPCVLPSLPRLPSMKYTQHLAMQGRNITVPITLFPAFRYTGLGQTLNAIGC